MICEFFKASLKKRGYFSGLASGSLMNITPTTSMQNA